MANVPTSFDRSSATDAEVVMRAAFPGAAVRRELLRCLLETIKQVEALAPSAWAVTLYETGFRLNVGQVEALTCESLVKWPFPTGAASSVRWPMPPPTAPEGKEPSFDDGGDAPGEEPFVRVLTQGDIPDEVLHASQFDDADLEITSTSYKSVALPQQAVGIFVRSPAQLRDRFESIADAQARYIALATKTPTGKVRTNTPFKRTHSPGLVEYAKKLFLPTEPASVAVNGDPESHSASSAEFFEGRPIAVMTTRYERRPEARRACLAHHGHVCAACGFDFGAVYGAVATHYIQVHHLNPLASFGQTTSVDPIEDMRPLCANCHAVAHFKSPPYSIDQIKSFIEKERNT